MPSTTSASASSGSSPRGRGKLPPPPQDRQAAGLIPAWAGKTSAIMSYPSMLKAHPRVGGENHSWIGATVWFVGSSPRGRGKRSPTRGARGFWRLIPAWAGKTLRACYSLVTLWAHPRVGGENSSPSWSVDFRFGSSPRGRGKRTRGNAPGSSPGLIPAWAGKTRPRASHTGGRQAHPRVGGENGDFGPGEAACRGSSPRGRGKRVQPTEPDQRGRLIPAWAGKTTRQPRSTPLHRAHPRVGGENLGLRAAWVKLGGSSPRGRGKLAHLRAYDRAGRLIPAWAGKTVSA